MKISLTDLDLFLDELRHRGPNVEPVVRVRKTSEGGGYTTYYLAATYARQYGEKVATVELRHRIGTWMSSLVFGINRDPDTYRAKVAEEEDERSALEVAWNRAYDEARARIAAVAEEIGVGVAGGEVTA